MSGRIDVLIPVYSRDVFHDQLLRRALDSLVRQTHRDFDVILVKDSCWANTDLVATEFQPRLTVREYRHVKAGAGAARNLGISNSDAEWIAHLDADDAWHEEKLEKQVQFLDEHPDCDILGTQAWDVFCPLSENERVEPNCFALGRYMTDAQIKARLPRENVMAHSSILMRRRILLELGGYDTAPACRGQEDYCLWKAAAARGYRFFNLPERLLFYSMGTSVEP